MPLTSALARSLLRSVALLLPLSLCACLSLGDPKAPIASELIAAPRADAARALVIVLPGRGDDLSALRRSGIATAIQSAWPEADVLLAEVGMGHYMQGRMPQRLHDEIVVPARGRADVVPGPVCGRPIDHRDRRAVVGFVVPDIRCAAHRPVCRDGQRRI